MLQGRHQSDAVVSVVLRDMIEVSVLWESLGADAVAPVVRRDMIKGSVLRVQ